MQQKPVRSGSEVVDFRYSNVHGIEKQWNSCARKKSINLGESTYVFEYLKKNHKNIEEIKNKSSLFNLIEKTWLFRSTVKLGCSSK